MIVIALAYLGARRAIKREDPVCALAVVAACQLLISPVSWSHHWVWIAPMLLPFAIQIIRGRERLKIAGLALLTVVFLIGPLLLFPVNHGLEMHWGWWENLIGDAYHAHHPGVRGLGRGVPPDTGRGALGSREWPPSRNAGKR